MRICAEYVAKKWKDCASYGDRVQCVDPDINKMHELILGLVDEWSSKITDKIELDGFFEHFNTDHVLKIDCGTDSVYGARPLHLAVVQQILWTYPAVRFVTDIPTANTLLEKHKLDNVIAVDFEQADSVTQFNRLEGRPLIFSKKTWTRFNYRVQDAVVLPFHWVIVLG